MIRKIKILKAMNCKTKHERLNIHSYLVPHAKDEYQGKNRGMAASKTEFFGLSI